MSEIFNFSTKKSYRKKLEVFVGHLVKTTIHIGRRHIEIYLKKLFPWLDLNSNPSSKSNCKIVN